MCREGVGCQADGLTVSGSGFDRRLSKLGAQLVKATLDSGDLVPVVEKGVVGNVVKADVHGAGQQSLLCAGRTGGEHIRTQRERRVAMAAPLELVGPSVDSMGRLVVGNGHQQRAPCRMPGVAAPVPATESARCSRESEAPRPPSAS